MTTPSHDTYVSGSVGGGSPSCFSLVALERLTAANFPLVFVFPFALFRFGVGELFEAENKAWNERRNKKIIHFCTGSSPEELEALFCISFLLGELQRQY